MIMKEYKSVVRSIQKLGNVNPLSGYFRYAQSLGRQLLLTLYDTPENRDPYYDSKTRRRGNSDYGNSVSLGNGYPALKPVGSRI